MKTSLRVVHYLNQFFGGLGGEEKADIGIILKDGPVGPGMALQAALHAADAQCSAEVVATVIAGDNFMAGRLDEHAKLVAAVVEKLAPDVLVAGPAFGAGRYGIACGAVCEVLTRQCGIPAVTAMCEENPGVALYRARTHIVPTAPTAAGMREVLPRLLEVAVRLAGGEPPLLGSCFSQGARALVLRERNGAERAVDMLLARLNPVGPDMMSELPLPSFDWVEPAPALANLALSTIVLITEGGLTPHDNPDRIEMSMATKFGVYSVEGLDRLDPRHWTVAHGGYDNSAAREDPHRLLPLDALRRCERQGLCRCASVIYTTAGNATAVDKAVAFGRGMAEDIRRRYVGMVGAVLTST